MDRDELIAWMEAHLGLRLESHPTDPQELTARSTVNDAPLFTVSIYEDKNGNWTFGGTGNHLTHFWDKLCKAGRG